MRRLSPSSFARRQILRRSTAPVTLLLVLVAFWYAVSGRRAANFTDMALSVAGFLFLVLATGGIALGYLAQYLSLTSKGLMPTPKRPWTLSVAEDGGIVVATHATTTSIPSSAVAKLTCVHDGNWDQIAGMEDKGLVIHLKSGGHIHVPGSSIGFQEALGMLMARHRVESLTIE